MINSIQRITQAYSQTPWRKQIQLLGIFLLCLLIIVFAASIYLNLNARVATYGREILLAQEKIQSLELVNADLRTQLGIVKSPAYLAQRATELGFESIERDEQLYIVVPGYINDKTITLAPPIKTNEKVTLTLPPDFTESLIDWFRGRMAFLLLPILEAKP